MARGRDDELRGPLVRHVVAGQKLILAIALGEPPASLPDERARGPHDEPATRAELLGLLAEADVALARLDVMDLGEPAPVPWGESRSRFIYSSYQKS